jgi:hypothetical protein
MTILAASSFTVNGNSNFANVEVDSASMTIDGNTGSLNVVGGGNASLNPGGNVTISPTGGSSTVSISPAGASSGVTISAGTGGATIFGLTIKTDGSGYTAGYEGTHEMFRIK